MKEFLNKRNIINLLLLGIMVLAIPLTVKLARQQQILFSRAAEAQIVFLTKDLNGTTLPDGSSCVITRNNKLVTLCPNVKIRLVAPTGADIKFQGRTALLPQGGFVSKVYAQECNEGGPECWDGWGYWVKRDIETNEVCSADGPHDPCGEAPAPAEEAATTTTTEPAAAVPEPAAAAPESAEPDTRGPPECTMVCPSGFSGTCGGHDYGNGCSCETQGQTCTQNPSSDGDGGGSPTECTVSCPAGYGGTCGGHNYGNGCVCETQDQTCTANPSDGAINCSTRTQQTCADGAGFMYCTHSSCTNPEAGCYSAPTGGVKDQCSGAGGTGAGTCEGRFTSACGTSGYPNNQLNATWNLSGAAGTCNVFIRDARGDHPINSGGACSGNWISTHSGSPITGANITNDGNFQLYVSNGTTTCTNQLKGNVTLNCGQPGPACDTSNNTLTFTCGSRAGTHQLTAKWLVRATGGACNVYIRAGRPGGGSADITINQGGACSGERTFTGTLPNGDVITNDGHYQLFVSNGSTCNNQLRGDVTLTCTVSGDQKCFVCVAVPGKGDVWRYPGDARGSTPTGNPNAECSDADKRPADQLDKPCGSTSPEKCFVCGNDGKYRYAGADGALSGCPSTATTCNSENANTCKSDQDLRTKLCNTAAAPVITKYRFAEDPSDLASTPINNYQQGGVTISHTFANTTPPEKFIWYQFGDDAGNWTQSRPGSILFVGPDPEIRGASCNLDITDGSLKFQVTGNNFGSRDLSNSHLAADNSNLEIKEWANQKVVARMANPSDTTTGKTYTVTLTRSDGVRATATCSVNTTQISLGAKLFCRAPSNFDQDNVKLLIVQNALGVGTTDSSGGFKAGGKTRETVTISKEGVISNLKTKLQEGIEYIICIKAPKSLRLCTEKFTAISGNNIPIKKFDLPVGDVNDDEAINSADASICKAEWGPARAGRAKACEFNRDNVTNSFEWSCLLHDFNKPNQPEPQ